MTDKELIELGLPFLNKKRKLYIFLMIVGIILILGGTALAVLFCFNPVAPGKLKNPEELISALYATGFAIAPSGVFLVVFTNMKLNKLYKKTDENLIKIGKLVEAKKKKE